MIIRYTQENFEDHWGFANWKNKTVLDIGADYGSTAECFLEYGASKVYASEGNKELYNQLVEYSKNKTKIIPIEKWLNNENDFIELFNVDKIDITKIDCEGCEEFLLKVPDYTLKSINEYVIECHSDKLLEEVKNKFLNIGYKAVFEKHLTIDISVIHLTCPDKKYSIVIPTYGTKGILLTDKLLESISKFNNSHLNEIIISEDGSNLDSMLELHKLKDKYKNIFKINLVFNPNYHSFSKTVNSGMLNTNQDDILLLNNDMIALTSFEPFTEFINSIDVGIDNVGIIGAKLLYPDNTIQHAGISRRKYTKNFVHVYKDKDSNYPDANYVRKYIAVTGACLYITRNLINKIGLFDENYIMSYEDIDYCVNAQLNGFDVYYNPEVSMIHYEKTTRQNTTNDNYNSSIFWNKWNLLYDNIDPNMKKEDIQKAGVTAVGALSAIYLIHKYK